MPTCASIGLGIEEPGVVNAASVSNSASREPCVLRDAVSISWSSSRPLSAGSWPYCRSSPMLPRSESGTRKFGAENLDQRWAELPWDEPAVLIDFKSMMNLFINTEGCIIRGGFMLLDTKCSKEISFAPML